MPKQASSTNEIEDLSRENGHLKVKLRPAELIIDVQKSLGDDADKVTRKGRLESVEKLSKQIDIVAACSVLNTSRATFYRRRETKTETKPRLTPTRALSADERQAVLGQLNSERFADPSPRQVFAKLLEEDSDLSSVRTMYRILENNQSSRKRRNQCTHPSNKESEFPVTGSNAVRSWDITNPKGPEKWTHYYHYVILDIYSRTVVGWMLAQRESDDLAKELIETTIEKQPIPADQLIIHRDRGPSMTSRSVAQ